MRIRKIILTLCLLISLPLAAQANVQMPSSINGTTPIFMFHEIGEGPNNLYVPEQDFERLMAFLSKEGYRTVTVSQLLDHKMKRGENDKLIALTFDDGYASFYNKAFPILKKYNFNATTFIITDMVNTPNHMTWQQLRKLLNGGIEVGSHSQTHPYLSKLDDAALYSQVIGSKQRLEELLNKQVTAFCYPYGDFNEEVIEEVKEAGYKLAVTVHTDISSKKDALYQLPRVNVYGGMTNHTLDSFLKMTPGQLDANLASYFQTVDLNENDANAYFNRAMALANLGKQNEAIRDYTKAMELNPKLAEAYNGRGYAYSKLGQYDQAIADYTKSCELIPNFSYAYNNRGSTYLLSGKYQEAIEDFSRVAEMDPTFPYLHFTYKKRGYAYAQLQDYEKALNDCTRSLELKNDYADAYYCRGYVYYLCGDYENSLNDLQKAIELDNSQAVYFYNLSKTSAALGQESLAKSMLQKSLELELAAATK